MGTRARRGRPPRLDREAVARAVLDVGFPTLTFAAVRKRLGVGESTLFRYAPDRDELVRLGLSLALESVEWPELKGTWRQVLVDYATCTWCFWEAHPGSATEASRGVITPMLVRLNDELCSFLMERGFTARWPVTSSSTWWWITVVRWSTWTGCWPRRGLNAMTYEEPGPRRSRSGSLSPGGMRSARPNWRPSILLLMTGS